MKRERQIYNALMRAVKEGCVPFGYYGPAFCSFRWAGTFAVPSHPIRIEERGVPASVHRRYDQ